MSSDEEDHKERVKPFIDLQHCRNSYDMMCNANQRNMDEKFLMAKHLLNIQSKLNVFLAASSAHDDNPTGGFDPLAAKRDLYAAINNGNKDALIIVPS